jgi:hypothetical protein
MQFDTSRWEVTGWGSDALRRGRVAIRLLPDESGLLAALASGRSAASPKARVEFRWPAILYRRESGALPSRSVIPSCAPSSAPIRALARLEHEIIGRIEGR